MKKLLVLLFVLPALVKAQPLKPFMRDDETGAICYQEIFNVHNRSEPQIITYGQKFLNYWKGEVSKYKIDAIVVDEAKHCAKALMSFDRNMPKKSGLGATHFTGEIYVYAKQNRSKIEITNFTYQSLEFKDKKGRLEDITDCGTCHVYFSLQNFIVDEGSDMADSYHDFLKKSVKKDRDSW